MAKRVKVIETKDYSSFRFLGAEAFKEGHPIDYIERQLLRDPLAREAWGEGWQKAKKEKAK